MIGGVLEEVPGALGVFLWQSLRDVRLWAATPPERRVLLFRRTTAHRRTALLAAAELPAELAPAAETLLALTRRAATDPALVQLAAAHVAAWAASAGYRRTALAFAEAAAAVQPQDARAALRAGQAAERSGEDLRAEAWFRRTVGLGRRAQEWPAAAEAYIELGRLLAARDQVEPARRHFLAAHRLARREALSHRLRGHAASGMFRLAVAERDDREVARWARITLQAFGTLDPFLFEAAHLTAERFTEAGEHRTAIRLLYPLRHARTNPADRIRSVTLLVRAAAGEGHRPTLDYAWSEARALIREHSAGEEAARQLLELARVGLGAVRPGKLAAVLTWAQELARECGNGALAEEAAALLAQAVPATEAES